ncbi:matrixin family metalloprotease [Gemmata sp. G18]|uniref:Matrixin family metalloprotease n=1 Tax=Gemmata palustris TaxID=2822762 RepID=A0ABS5BPX3_9BACT|nr:matrixin family metalloprotease [Gemmata palustris]MBP3955742.1 matrixin family metalloprotease [Gemmata palustris]
MKFARLGSAFEALEDRSLPTTFGVPWADPEHLTFSFVADGTQTPLGTSSLSQVLNSAGTSAQWKLEILRAFQTWAVNANINIGLVTDGGQVLGAVGAVQGDARFGDIRVAAVGLSPDVLASTSPFSWTGTTLSGDMVLNASAPFGIGSAYDLYSVALHEAGHAFGLDHDHDHDEASAIHSGYEYQTGLSASDIAHLQALYGARRADAYDLAGGNDTVARASAMPRNSVTQLLVSGDLTTMSDVDYYKFTAPAITAMLSNVTVRLKTEGLSLLTARVTVYDSAGRVVASGASADPLNNDLVLTFKPGLFGGNYTIKVEGARNDVFDIGGYKLAVDFLSVTGLLSPITTTLTGVLDGHTDDILATALGVQTNTGTDARFDAVYRGVLEDSYDVDSYRVRTDRYAPGTSVTLNVMVWGLDANPVDARVRVFDANGTAVAFQVLSNDRGLFSVQVLNAVSGKDYYVQVSAREGATKATGGYFFAADFNQIAPLVFDNVANGTVAAGKTTTADTVSLSEAGVYQFALGAQGQKAGDSVTMTVYDGDGNVVFTLTSVAGRPPVTSSQYLKAGTYTVKYAGAKTNSSATGYGLFMTQLSEGVGPYATSTATPPTSAAPPASPPPPSQSPPASPPPSQSPPTSPPASPPPSYSYNGSTGSNSSGYYYSY